MRIRWKKWELGRLPLFPIFMAGVLLGIALMNFGKNVLLENTGLLDETTLYHMRYMTVDGKALFVYSLGQRFLLVAAVTVLATTYLGLAVICVVTGWYGLLMGMFFSAGILRYGVKGILFAFVGMFPQYLFYIPAFLSLMLWCEGLCREICFHKGAPIQGEGRAGIWTRLLRFLAILLAVFLGCLLESYVNPVLMTALLKIF